MTGNQRRTGEEGSRRDGGLNDSGNRRLFVLLLVSKGRWVECLRLQHVNDLML